MGWVAEKAWRLGCGVVISMAAADWLPSAVKWMVCLLGGEGNGGLALLDGVDSDSFGVWAGCFSKQGSDLIELRLTWRETENFIFERFIRIF